MTFATFHPAPRYMSPASVSHDDITDGVGAAAPERPAQEPEGAALVLCIPLGALAWAGLLAWVLT